MSSYNQLEGHTYQRFDGELNHLHLSVLEMGGLVADQVKSALDSIEHHKDEKARTVCKREQLVDALEKKIDGNITATLAKRSPLARDLRGLLAFSKAAADLEHIGNEAVRIADISKKIYRIENLHDSNSMLLHDVHNMGLIASRQLTEALNIFDLLDFHRAETMLNNNNDLNNEFEMGLRRLTTFVMEDPRKIGSVINLVLVLKSLARIGSLIQNLAEHVVFIVSGEDVRHSDG
jgi:phosphate transport system protein